MQRGGGADLNQPFTVFNPLSVKLIMIDHMTHYVHDIVARFIEDTLHLSTMLPFITPNFVSFSGLALAFIGCSLIALSDKPTHARLGAVLFELRNLADSLDGVVFRSRARQRRIADGGEGTNASKSETYQSHYGSAGYNVDLICDGLGGLFFVIAIFIKFIRHPPHVRGSKIHRLKF